VTEPYVHEQGDQGEFLLRTHLRVAALPPQLFGPSVTRIGHGNSAARLNGPSLGLVVCTGRTPLLLNAAPPPSHRPVADCETPIADTRTTPRIVRVTVVGPHIPRSRE